MSWRPCACGTLGLGFVLLAAIAVTPSLADDSAVRRALGQKVSLDFEETPLQEAAASLGTVLGVPVRLDPEAFADEDHHTDQRVTLHVHGISAESALNLLTRGVNVAPAPKGWGKSLRLPEESLGRAIWTVRDGDLLITSWVLALPHCFERSYDVADLVSGNGGPAAQEEGPSGLPEALVACVEPESWEETSPDDDRPKPFPLGRLRTAGRNRAIAVTQTWRGHYEIQRLLDKLRAMWPSPVQGPVRRPLTGLNPSDEQLRRALAEPVSFDFVGRPLAEVLREFQDRLHVPVVLDTRTLQELKIAADAPVTLRLADVPAELALDTFLDRLGLTWTYWSEVVWVTSREEAEQGLSVRVYDVSDLVLPDATSSNGLPDYDGFIDAIESTIDPDSWRDVGAGEGSIARSEVGEVHTLVIANTWHVHCRIERMFRDLRALRHVKMAGHEPSPTFLPLDPAEERVREALARRVSLDLRGVPLDKLLAQLAKSHGIPIVLDETALEEMTVRPDKPVSIQLANVTFESALKVLLRDLGLTYTYRNEALFITTQDRAENGLTTRVHDVCDLVTIPQPQPAPGDNPQPIPRRRPGGFWSSGDYLTDRAIERAMVLEDLFWDGEIDDTDFDGLIDLIEQTIEPASWSDTGGGQGAIAAVDSSGIRAIVFQQTWQIHRKVETLLKDLRGARRPKPGQPAPALEAALPPPPDAAIREALARPITLRFQGTPLPEAVAELADATNLHFVLDRWALEEDKIATDMPVTFHRGPMPLESALDLMLGPRGLAWTVEGELLWITTPKRAESILETKVYDVSFLCPLERRDEDASASGIDFDSLIDAIEACLDPDSWQDTGAGQGSIAVSDVGRLQAIVVSQTFRGQGDVAASLADLRALRRGGLGSLVARPGPRPMTGVRNAGIAQALGQPLRVDFHGATPADVAGYLERALGVPVALDEKALAGEQIPPITISRTFLSAPAALDAVLSPAGLTWAPYRGVIWITTPDGEAAFQEAEVFDVYDLPSSQHEGDSKSVDFDSLIARIRSSIEPDSWQDTGSGDGAVAAEESEGLAVLWVSNTWKVRRRVEALLREAAGRQTGGGQGRRKDE